VVGGGPVVVEALPGALSSQHCGLANKRIGSGTLLYGARATLSLYLRDAFGNYISCGHYARGLGRHNISHVSIYHEPGDDAPAAWTAEGKVGRCHDAVYREGHSSVGKVDGVVEVSFTVPHRNVSADGSKDQTRTLDLEVARERERRETEKGERESRRRDLEVAVLHAHRH